MLKRSLWIVLMAVLAAVPGPLRADDPSTDDPSQGWTPNLANKWMEAQMDYAHALKQYGKGSPEATQAEVTMNTLARQMGIKPTGEIPQVAPPEPVEVSTGAVVEIEAPPAEPPPTPIH